LGSSRSLTGTGLPEPFSVTVAAVLTLGAALAKGCSANILNVHVHYALHDVLDHFTQKIAIRPLSKSSDNAMLGLAIMGLRLKFWLGNRTLNQDP
jgi:hypothetical protein